PTRLPLQNCSRSGSAQCKPVVRSLPQAQSDQVLIETIIDFWPKRADDIFSCRGRVPKIFRFEIQMPAAPWLKRFFDRVPKCNEVIERSAARIVIASNGRLCQVPMTMTS